MPLGFFFFSFFFLIALWIKVDPYYSSRHNFSVSHSQCTNQPYGHSPAKFWSELAWSCSPFRLSLDERACLILQMHCLWAMQWHFLWSLSLVDLAVMNALFSGVFFWTSHEFSHTQVLHVCKFASSFLGANQLVALRYDSGQCPVKASLPVGST